jgi:1-acyl-sn-glycerol-3-phosphate acyltransferase
VRYHIAANAATDTLRDASRLVIPARRLLSGKRIRRVAAAPTDAARDLAIRRWAAELLDVLDVRLRLKGLSHIDADQAYLVLSLHESLLDVPLLLQLLLPMTFVARADLATERPMDRLLEASRPILIKPEAPSALRVVLREADRVARQGRSTVIFPQGSVLGIETSFQRGALVVAHRLSLPVLPVIVAGGHRVWEHPFSPLVRRQQQVHMEVLAPRSVETDAEYRTLEREMKNRAAVNTWAAPRRYVPERDGYWDGYRFDVDPDFALVDEQVRRHRRGTLLDDRPRATRTV